MAVVALRLLRDLSKPPRGDLLSRLLRLRLPGPLSPLPLLLDLYWFADRESLRGLPAGPPKTAATVGA